MRSFLSRIIRPWIDFVFPRKCLDCGTLFYLAPANRPPPESNRATDLMAPFVCPDCRTDIPPLQEPLCCVCGNVFATNAGPSHYCADCLTHPPHFRQARALGRYDQLLLIAIHQFKYKGHLRLAEPLGRMLYRAFEHHYSNSVPDAIAPVPLHARKIRKRGYNQTYLLVRKWPFYAAASGSRMRAVAIQPNLLKRRRHTQPQTGLDRRQRQANIRRAFAVDQPRAVAGKHILVVDDVYTTGATANECARVLVRAGAAQVDVLTLARAV